MSKRQQVTAVRVANVPQQELARLFYRSGWTQEELAKKEGKSRQWIDQRLRFGRFLEFATSGSFSQNPGFSKLTDRRFRDYWSRTDKTESNERIRRRHPQGRVKSLAGLGLQTARPADFSQARNSARAGDRREGTKGRSIPAETALMGLRLSLSAS
jgi:transcriptional regulator with XRE-family HTH domain